MPKDSGKANAGVDCRPAGNVGLFNRLTVIILLVISVIIIALGIGWLIAYNRLPTEQKNDSVVRGMSVFTIVVLAIAIVVFLWAMYAIIAPDGTFKTYIKPQLASSQIGVTKLNRA